ncbi:perforin-1-like [Lissotriton helveticus]
MRSHFGLLLCCWMLFLTSPKLSGVEAGCRPGNTKECETAPFVPGHNLGGEGFDVTKLERKGAYVIKMEDTGDRSAGCKLCRNHLQDNRYQKIPKQVVDWRILTRHSMKATSKLHESSTSLKLSQKEAINNNWKVGLSTSVLSIAVGGSHSRLSQFAEKRSSSARYSYISQEVLCTNYRYGIKSCPDVTDNFNKMLKSLPSKYNSYTKAAFRQLIDVYGTHYIRQVTLGGRIKDVTAIKTCDVTLGGVTKSDVKDCLNAEVSASTAGMISLGISSSVSSCQSKARSQFHKNTFSEKFSERYSEVIGGSMDKNADLLFPNQNGGNRKKSIQRWITSLKGSPDVVEYTLESLHLVMCSQGPVRENLKAAISEYILEKQTRDKCPSCPRGSRVTRQGRQCTCSCPSSSFMNSECCPSKKGVGELTVYVREGNGLRGDSNWLWNGHSDAYVVVSVTSKYGYQRTPTIDNNNNPRWYYTMHFGTVNLFSYLEMKLIVYDQDWFWSRNTGECRIKLDRASTGFISQICYVAKGGHIRYQYKIECAPGLGGSKCSELSPP